MDARAPDSSAPAPDAATGSLDSAVSDTPSVVPDDAPVAVGDAAIDLGVDDGPAPDGTANDGSDDGSNNGFNDGSPVELDGGSEVGPNSADAPVNLNGDAIVADDASVADTPSGDAEADAAPGDAAEAEAGGGDAAADTGVVGARLVISESPELDFGTWGVGRTTQHIFFVQNAGDTAASNISASLSAPFSFTGGTFPGAGGSCGANLPAGARCHVIVAFAPAAVGFSQTALTFSYDSAGGPAGQSASITLKGTGTTAGHIIISDFPTVYYSDYGVRPDPATYDFGRVGLGRTADKILFLTNTGAQTATALAPSGIVAPFSFVGGSFPGVTGTCSATLAAGASCTAVVRFAPSAASTSSATLSLAYADGVGTNATATRAMTGTGTSEPFLAIWDFNGVNIGIAWDFGAAGVGSTKLRRFIVTNSGGAPATAIAGAVTGAGFTFRAGAYPGAGGTCSATLAPGDSCTVSVAFGPTVVGVASGRLSLIYAGGGPITTTTAGRDLVGSGTDRGALEISAMNGGGGIIYDFGTRGVGTTAEQGFRITNVGGGDAVVSAPTLAAPFGIKGGSFPCSGTLAAGASCSFTLTFTPSGTAAVTAALRIAYNDGSDSRSEELGLRGAGTTVAHLVVSHSRDGRRDTNVFDFGVWGSPVDVTLYVVNVGALSATALAPLTPAAPFSWNGGYPGAGGDCGGGPLAPGAACSVVVRFSGAASGASSVGVTYNDGSGAVAQADLPVTGTSTALPLVGVAECPTCRPSSDGREIDFGTIGTGRRITRTAYLVNMGGAKATLVQDAGLLGSAFAYTTGAFPGDPTGCGAELDAGKACRISVDFAPTMAGLQGSPLGVSWSDGSAAHIARLGLTGTATSSAYLVIRDWQSGGGTPSGAYDFGAAGVAIDHTFWVTNEGGGPATAMADGGGLASNFAWKSGNYPGAGGTCGATLAAGARCSVVVTFTPQGTGARASAFTINYNDSATAAKASRALSGTAISGPNVVIYDWSADGPGSAGLPYDFGTYGVSVAHVFTLKNTGSAAAQSLSGSGLPAADFGWTGGSFPGGAGVPFCGTSLAAGATCSVSVTFTPTGSGARSGKLTVSWSDGSATSSAARSVAGTATDRALLRIRDQFGGGGGGSNDPPYDFGTWGVTVPRTFYVSNDGGADATALADAGGLSGSFVWAGTPAQYPGGGTCGSMLAKGGNCTVSVTFAPSGNGPAAGRIKISYLDGATAQTAERGLIGTATTRAFILIADWASPFDCNERCGPYDYGVHSNGTVTSHVFRVFNTGAQSASLGDAAGLTAPFGWSTSAFPGTTAAMACTGSLASNASCLIDVAFAPSVAGTFGGQIGLTYDDGGGGRTAVRSIRGTAQVPPAAQ